MPERNIKLLIAYDGSEFSGWQIQPDKRTVQEEIENAIGEITGVSSRLAGAGRTDTGVHAIGQVASFRTDSNIPAEKFRPALQSKLADDVVIRESAEVDLDFHAGYAAKWKQYRYLILNAKVPNPHLGNYATRIHDNLNVVAMDIAARSLVGTHDFRSFESHYPNKATSVRTILHCRVHAGVSWELWQPGVTHQQEWSPFSSAPEQVFVYLDIVADGFLYNMVRAIAGTLIKIGQGSWAVEEAMRIVEAQDRSQAGPTAPAEGLYLMHVEYEREFES